MSTYPPPHPRPRPARSGDPAVIYAAQPQYRVVEMMPPGPMMICPFCGYTVSPVITHEPSLFAWMMCILVSILFMPFFFIGFLIGYFILVADSLQEPKYVCPLCGNFLPVNTILI
ncbi:uncharacterized protein LOC118434315 [Folsomia candida]|uniref:LITAF domain-containing protein n=1 Tax=Folsomia candida TaxID=158441 RepID=A0A226ET58_FOLCA|nr:uncharacterized protein LOC118434315 [Folsomia candida]OXA59786.1 hypothetical protein Fcan01_04468 [Folsomia candida]